MYIGFLTLVASQSTVKVCDDSSVFKVQSLTSTPDYPVPGQNWSLVTVFDAPYQIDSGTSKYSCVLNGLPVWSETYDLCTQTECPITTGEHTTTGEDAVPKVSGKLDCSIQWFHQDTSLMCVEFIMKIGNLRGIA